MKTIIFISLLILHYQTSFSQSRKLIVELKSAENKKIENTLLIIDDVVRNATETGEFIIYDLTFNKHNIKIICEGYNKIDSTFRLSENVTNLIFELQLSSKELNEIKIVALRSENEKTVEIGKIPIRPFDLPQSISIVDRETMNQQQSQQMSDVLKNTNGIYIMGNTGGYQEEIAGRGFAYSSSNTFKNGVRFNNAIIPEMSSLERLEVLKGCTAILFGNVAAGGVLNLITKKPQFNKGGEISMRVSSFEFYKPSVDIYGAANNKKTIAYRLNSSYENAKSFRDVVKSNRYYINPSLLFLIGKKTELLIEGDYLNDIRTADFGVGAIDYQLIDIPRNTFIGIAWSTIKSSQSSLTTTLTHQLSKKWQIRNINSYQTFQNDLFSNVRPNSSSKFIQTDGTWIRGVQRTQVDEDYYLSQLDIIGKFNTGKIKHALLVGTEIDQYFTNTIAFNGISAYDTINIFSLNIESQKNDIPSLTMKTSTKTPRRRVGTYVQDLISITEKIKLLAGIRLSYLESRSNLYTHSTDLTTYSTLYDHAFSPRVGIVYQPIKTMSLFSSFSNSFAPNTGVDFDGKALVPSIIDQYEVGVKNDFFKGLMTFNVTAYLINNSNVAQMVLENGNTNSNIKELAGAISSKGLEIDASSKSWKGLSFLAGYSFNETKYTESTIYAVGAKLLYQPRNTANASVYYEVQKNSIFKGLNFGLSGLYFGVRSAGRLTRLNVPNDTYHPIYLASYMTLDASAGYTKNNISIRFKIANIINALSYNVHDDNSVNPIAPRMFTTTLSLKL
jgi:iron complex outermembrane receptor protein